MDDDANPMDDWDDVAEDTGDEVQNENYSIKLDSSAQKRNAQARRRYEMLLEERRLKDLLDDVFAF